MIMEIIAAVGWASAIMTAWFWNRALQREQTLQLILLNLIEEKITFAILANEELNELDEEEETRH